MGADRIDVLAVMDRYGFTCGDPDSDCSKARAAVAEALEALRTIERRAKPHPDDTDADRKRNLYHCEAIARFTLTRCGVPA